MDELSKSHWKKKTASLMFFKVFVCFVFMFWSLAKFQKATSETTCQDHLEKVLLLDHFYQVRCAASISKRVFPERCNFSCIDATEFLQRGGLMYPKTSKTSFCDPSTVTIMM